MVASGAASGIRVLIVEDDGPTRTLLERTLEVDGFEPCAVGNAREALDAAASFQPAAVLLDLTLPDADGLSVLRSLREALPDVPCIIVSGRDEEASRVLGLRLGADDYVVKPFSSGELMARLEAVLRRSRAPEPTSVLRRGDLFIDLAAHEVHHAGHLVELTAKEYGLLHFLASQPRQVFTREQLLQQVWSSDAGWQDVATVTEHVRRLRRKLEVDPDRPALIETVRGVGYRFSGA